MKKKKINIYFNIIKIKMQNHSVNGKNCYGSMICYTLKLNITINIEYYKVILKINVYKYDMIKIKFKLE